MTKKPLQSIFLLMAPCLALIGMALYLTRRAEVTPPGVAQSGPFRVRIVGIETQKITPTNVYEGYNRPFHLVFDAQGAKPKGWGEPDTSWGNHGMETYKFWLERDGKREIFVPLDTQIYTSRWDADRKRYTNAIELRTGSISDDAALKMSGIGQIQSSGKPKLGPPIPFVVTLKKAGQKWRVPQVSRATGLTIKKIEITKRADGQTEVVASILLDPRTSSEMTRHSTDFVDTNWRQLGLKIGVEEELKPASSSRVYKFRRQWTTSKMSKSKPNDVIMLTRVDFKGRWPLELAFPVKKDGKPIFGIVQPLTRPPGKKPLR